MFGRTTAMLVAASALALSNPQLAAAQEVARGCCEGPTAAAVAARPSAERPGDPSEVGLFRKLPAEVTYRMTLAPPIAVYPPGSHVPTLIRGAGTVTLAYERIREPGKLSVRVKDLDLRILPFSFPLDVDKDGKRESLELPALRIGKAFLDLEASAGTLDLKTGDFDLNFAFAIAPKALPMLKELGLDGVRFLVEDRGVMDLRTGAYEIHCGVVEIAEGPLAGYVIRAGGPGTLDSGSPSTVDLKLGVAGAPDLRCSDIPSDQNRVIICPGDRVLLCWNSSQDVNSVDISPGVGTGLPATGELVVMPPAPGPGDPAEIVYRVTTNGGSTPGAEDTVTVVFYRGQVLGPYQAEPNRSTNNWSLEIPPTSLSGRIHVERVELVRSPGCLDWSRFFLEHQSATLPGGIDYGGDLGGAIAVPFPAAGTWYFTPRRDPPRATPDPRDAQLPVCFQFAGACR